MTTIAYFNSYQYAVPITFARIVDSAGADLGLSVTTDSFRNVYFSGYYNTGTPTIKDQTGNFLGTLPTSAGTDVAFVCKFDSNGNYQYSRIVDSAGKIGRAHV